MRWSVGAMTRVLNHVGALAALAGGEQSCERREGADVVQDSGHGTNAPSHNPCQRGMWLTGYGLPYLLLHGCSRSNSARCASVSTPVAKQTQPARLGQERPN